MWSSYSTTSFFKFLLIFIFWQVSALSKPFPLVWNVPAENPYFVGREDVLAEISNIFEAASPKTAVIGGHQGLGKSQTAKRFVYQNFANYDVVWWFRANQYLKPQFEKFALIIAPFLEIDIQKSITDIEHGLLISIIKEGIRRKNLKCLIIFDDALTYSEVEPYVLFSHTNTIHTLITTKNGNFSTHTIQIKPFPRADSLKYINLFLPNDSEIVKDQLAEHLGDCPAALAVSIDYIKSYPGMNIEQYLSKYKAHKSTLPSSTLASKMLGSSIDRYETNLLIAIQMNMRELQLQSEEAFQFLGLLSVLHRDEISLPLIEKWVKLRGIKANISTLTSLIKQYSLIEVNDLKHNKEAYITMQDLIQEIVSSLVPVPEKKKLIDEAVSILKEFFSETDEKNYKTILKDNKPLLHAIKISKEANAIDHHNKALSSLRVRLNTVLLGAIRDLKSATEITEHLERDFENQIKLDREDEIRYYIEVSFFHGIHPDFDKAIMYGEKALKLCDLEEGMNDEKLRLYANMIQYHALQGLLDECQPFIARGEKLFAHSQFPLNNAHYIYVLTILLLNQGEIQKTIKIIQKHKGYLEKQDCHPIMHFFLLCQLAEAQIKNGDIKAGTNTLTLTGKLLREYYTNEDNHFFCKIDVLVAVSKFTNPKSFLDAKSLLLKALKVYEKVYNGSDKHRNQGYAHLQLGKLFHLQQQYYKAKVHYLKSEAIFDKILKRKKIDDVSDLYKQLSILGVDTKDESLAQTYLKKQMDIFGLAHPKTKDIALYFDENGAVVPF